MVQLCCIKQSTRHICTSILLHMMKLDKVFKYNLIKRFEGLDTFLRLCLMLDFTNVIYNASFHCWYTTKNNKFLTKTFAVVMPSYLTFATAKVKTKLPSLFFPNATNLFKVRFHLKFLLNVTNKVKVLIHVNIAVFKQNSTNNGFSIVSTQKYI